MNKNNCYQLGHITRTHGLNGEVIFFLDVDFLEDYADLASVFLEIKGDLLPYFIQKINIQRDNKAIVKLEDVDTIDQAKMLINCPIYLPDDELDELEEGQFYYHEIVGYHVQDSKLGQLGTVTSVYTMTTQDLIAMQYQGQEVLIPVNDDIVTGIDRDNKWLLTNLPEGLVDVFMIENPKPDDED
jgi:16S rRNA processing protein RimM